MISRTVISGRLTRDPELRYTPSAVAVASFTVAVERPFKNAQGERQADFFDVVAWRGLAEFIVKYTAKGLLINVEGRMQMRAYETQEGQKRKVWELIADNIQPIEWKKGEQQPAQPAQQSQGTDLKNLSLDDLPF